MSIGIHEFRTRAVNKAQDISIEFGAVVSLTSLVGLGVLGELFLIHRVVQPLWLFTHRLPAGLGEPVSDVIGMNVEGLRNFLAITTIALGLYVAAYLVTLVRPVRHSLPIILGFTLLFSVTLLYANPGGANDIFANIVDGRMAWIHGLNPMVVPAGAAYPSIKDPFFPLSVRGLNETSYYGPLWYLLLFFPTRLSGPTVADNVITFRAFMIPFVLGITYLTARIISRRRPRLAPAAALLVGWSPLLLWESAANGHNDFVMLFFAIFAIERALSKDWTKALPLLALSVLIKYVTLMLLPLFLITAWRSEGRRCLRPFSIGCGVGAALTAIMFLPFWDGTATFASLIGLGANHFISSPATVLGALLDGNQSKAFFTSPAAGEHAKLITGGLFVVAYGIICLRLWRRSDDLITASFYSLFFYLILACWWFFPWYVCWLLPLGGALIGRRPAPLAILFSATALYGYAVLAWMNLLVNWDTNFAFPAAMSLTVFAPPLVYWAGGLPQPTWLSKALRDDAAIETQVAPIEAVSYNRSQRLTGGKRSRTKV